ncbi:MAG: LacI family DNA-binding transcriptional regulator [Selenomonadaceae bacterium]|nr:LacI family DNA-binding transcriptional regulator [Selenomonadaceae bacterium]
MENNKVTIQDIARLAGVSKSTVSRYLNRGYISDEKAERIRSVISETGFKSTFFAKRLKTKRSKLIGLVLPRIDSVSVGKLLAGIGYILEPAGYQAIMLVSQLDEKKELENIISLYHQGVDGIIIDSVAITPQHIALQQDIGIPLLYTGQKHPDANCLKIDDEAAGRMMGAYLSQMGHLHAVFAGVTKKDVAVGIERRKGFAEAFLEGRPDAKVDFIETGFGFLEAYNLAGDMLQRNPTVVVGATDNISLGILRYFHEREIRVPEEISVAGFGGYDVGAVVYPALTTIAFNFELVGMNVAQRMLDLIDHRPTENEVELPFFFLERESVRRMGSGESTRQTLAGMA